MTEADILKQFFQDQLGNGYRVDAFRNAVSSNAPSTEVMRIVKSTDEIIAEMIADKTIRAVIRTSQGEYIGLANAYGASFTWSLELSVPVDYNVDDDLIRIRDTFTEKIIPVEHGTDRYEMLLTFRMPAKFAATTINGTEYQQVVWGGSATIVQNSVVANGYAFYIGDAKIPGVLSLSSGFTPQGENYTTERAIHQCTAVQTFTNAVGLSIHATKNDPIIQKMIAAATLGTVNGFSFTIKQNDTTVAAWDVAVFNQVGVSGSLGSYVLIDVQILRS